MDEKSNIEEEKNGDNLKLFSLLRESLFLGKNSRTYTLTMLANLTIPTKMIKTNEIVIFIVP